MSFVVSVRHRWRSLIFAVFWGMRLAQALSAQTSEQSHERRFETQTANLARSDRELTDKLKVNPNDAEELHQRGRVRLQQLRIDDAISDLRKALELDPYNSRNRTDLASALFDSGKRDDAIAEVKQAIANDPRNFAAEALMGRLLVVTGGDLKDAIGHMLRSLDIDADQPDLRFDLINALRQEKDYTAAGVQIRILGVSLPPGDPRLEYARASVYLDLGHPEAAILHLHRALQANPNFVAARQDLIASLIQLRHWQEASEVLGPFVEQQPKSAQLAYMDALVLENTQHPQAAEAEANRALKLKPDYAEALTILGISQAAQGRHSEAVGSLEQAAALQPNSFDAQFYLGRERYALNDAAGAAKALQQAVQLRPANGEARFFLGTALESSGDKDGAMTQYSELVRLRPDDPRGHVGLGSILLRYGKTEEATVELTKARQLDPNNFETAMDIGKALARQGNWEESIRYLREASQKMPSSPEAHYQLALSLKRAGRDAEAAREFAEVDRLNQNRRGVSPN